MRFNFSSIIDGDDEPSRPASEPEWIPLQKHPVFTVASSAGDHTQSAFGVRRNLLTWDGASYLYFWNCTNLCLHRITIRLGDPNPTAVMAASPSKVLEADVPVNSFIDKISVNKNGSLLLLSAASVVHVLYLNGRPSAKDNNTLICRVVSVGSPIYFECNNALRILQVSWHPCKTHLGILSSDSIFRLFDLSSDFDHPEQEYYLQPVERGRHCNASSLCPVDFSFGGDHMWDRFTVFVLFSDGSIYILCPVVPFGSIYRLEHILEIYNDAKKFGLKSANSTALCNSSLAISWLEATFPELAKETTQGKNLCVVNAFPYAFLDASLLLQGPLHYVSHSGEPEREIAVSKNGGRAVSLLFNTISEDSILVTSWSNGHLKIDALSDEIQPAWKVGINHPRFCVDSSDRITSFAMICESNPIDPANASLDLPPDQTPWLGQSPPLLSLALVDLALPRNMKLKSSISIYVDPLIPEYIYSCHGGGIDSIVLHSLPFTDLAIGKDQRMKSPSVNPVLSTYQGDFSSPSPLSGFVALSDSFGYSWIVGITSSGECAVLEMRTWNKMLPIYMDRESVISAEDPIGIDTPSFISKELLSGPKMVIIPSASPSLRSVSADSIEGQSTLHEYFKLFHKNYVIYAHKVYLEAKQHESHSLKRIIDDQHGRVEQSEEKLMQVEQKQVELQNRLDYAIQRHNLLNERLRGLRKFPGAHRMPLSKAERGFKSELDRFTEVELDALRSSIETSNGRLKKIAQSVEHGNVRNPSRIKNRARESQISELKSLISKLSLVNGENSKKIKIVESELRRREKSC